MKKLFPLFILSLIILFSCGKDELKEIEITFVSPVNNEQVTLDNAENFTFRINLSAENDLHDYSVLVYPENNPSDKIVDASGHRHRTFIELTYERDLSSYASGTVFIIEVEVCIDHDCEKTPFRESISFSVV